MESLRILPGNDLADAANTRPAKRPLVVPFETDRAYFGRRSAEERAAADRAGEAHVAALHHELADRYGQLAAAIGEAEERLG